LYFTFETVPATEPVTDAVIDEPEYVGAGLTILNDGFVLPTTSPQNNETRIPSSFNTAPEDELPCLKQKLFNSIGSTVALSTVNVEILGVGSKLFKEGLTNKSAVSFEAPSMKLYLTTIKYVEPIE
jgi:hypothetical protein